jgi:thymidylate synthase
MKMIVKDLLKEYSPEEVFEKARGESKEYVHKLRAEGKISFSETKDGGIPTVHVVRRTLPEVWEDTTMVLMGIGQEVRTHYDPVDKKGKHLSFPSLEGTVMMHIEKPFGEPRFHKNYLGGWLGFGSYRAEVEGVHNHWMIPDAEVVAALKEGKFDEIKSDQRWKYTYNQRIYEYPYLDIDAQPQTINQIEAITKKLLKDPLRKDAQVVTWDARWDNNDGTMGGVWNDYHSPCLQRFWFRLVPLKDEEGYRMNVNSHWRSRDHLKAVPQNIYGITEAIHEPFRKDVEKRLGVPVERGRYVDISDSLHLYGHYLDSRSQGNDADRYLEDIFLIARGQPIEKRLVLPGTPLYETTMEEIEKEYRFTKENPDFGRGGG